MPVAPDPAFSRRAATVLLVVAVAVFVLGVIALAAGWIEVATACAAVFTVMWLAMRQRTKRVAREAEAANAAPHAPPKEPRSTPRRRQR